MTPERYMELRKLADDLIASCDGGAQFWDVLEGLSVEECKVMDGMALECCDCGQYYEASSMKDRGHEFICEGCDE